ncbi:MAG: hypothetical protein M1835_005413 [Candelina submexicana]|nr:MAG: hypothetical protein M1835_005413 [Candelina submexicana]
MAPLRTKFLDIPDLSISSLELDQRSAVPPPTDSAWNLSSYLSSLGLAERERKFSGGASRDSILSSVLKRSASPSTNLSPRDIGLLSRAKDAAPTPVTHNAGINPVTVNNKGILALFGLISAALVLASIWFFFWAKNGGFVFRQGDWDDYKSTVLRRKGPNGTTLSNATKSTKLGNDSIEGDYDRDDMVYGHSNRRDRDVRAYRHEKPARVGGLNRQPDGTHYDHTNTDRSELMTERMTEKTTPTSSPEKKKPAKNTAGFFARKMKAEDRKAKPQREKESKKKEKAKKPAPRQPSTAYSYTQGDDNSTVITDSTNMSEDRRPLRHSHQYTPNRSRYSSSSPTKHHHRQAYYDHPNFDHSETLSTASYLESSQAGTSDTGTKSYVHHIPGLSKGRGTDTRDFAEEMSRSAGARRQAGGGRSKGGYRRGGGRRRDSLSDSEGDTETVRS